MRVFEKNYVILIIGGDISIIDFRPMLIHVKFLNQHNFCKNEPIWEIPFDYEAGPMPRARAKRIRKIDW